eukprot:CAMPEP_0197532388 /NCGR_PEP_ID=MMETSP1318-20131121/39508_1 /TAXON_ID=552666 /ORGANISM="Partenskyella glossopodia, Strain RCC365" /LENGTH=160 /DNA_ID=CAMNT_0043088931 /DNA_START=494 /DNA_END=977 /DNA_ORIENTATION=+
MALTSLGTPIVQIMGNSDFMKFYIGSGFLSSITGAGLSAVQYMVRQSPQVLARMGLGASGPVVAVVVVWANLFPTERLQIIFLPFISFESMNGVKGLVAFDTLGALYGFIGDSPIGHGAHLGGALCGYLMYNQVLRKYNKKEFGGKEREEAGDDDDTMCA